MERAREMRRAGSVASSVRLEGGGAGMIVFLRWSLREPDNWSGVVDGLDGKLGWIFYGEWLLLISKLYGNS